MLRCLESSTGQQQKLPDKLDREEEAKKELTTHILPLFEIARARPEMQGTNFLSSPSTNNFSETDNGSALQSKIFVFKTTESSTKLVLILSLVTVAITGFVGNILVLCYLKTKKKAKSIISKRKFEKNFNVYIKSLAISDVLSVVISIPLVCIHLLFDLLQRGWGCKIARYFTLVFPCVTMYNLLVISIEKYFSTRKVPRTFNHSTVKKMVLFAWLAGFLIVFLPAATFDGVSYNLNATHYTVVCRYDNKYLPFRITFITFAILVYLIPMVIIAKVNISLAITIWRRVRRPINIQRDNGIKMKLRAATIRSTWIMIALTFAFIFPYFLYIGQTIYNNVTKAAIDFETDVTIRAFSALIAMSNPAVKFGLYLVQMKDFRAFLRKLFTKRCVFDNPPSAGVYNPGIELQQIS